MAEGGQSTIDLYRHTLIGDYLCDALEEMVEAGRLNEQMAHTVLNQFDASFLDALKHVSAKASIKANATTYRYYNNVWQFTLENVVLKLNQGSGSMSSAPQIQCERAKVVCMDCKLLEPS
uniref:Transcription initiation factor IIA subunit 2 n=1 Tax=Chlamydomonas euryale TaxID=1486919 RepID=A0A7R9V6L5_9CHLO|mmetsp:Transcript_22927/g.68154  ORF Transcript_22927/g.68154 Transcript_22927/m.68154 type:complete len:120 (+) Transcript_22927:154-513(+)